MSEDRSRVVRLVQPRQDEAQGTALPPEFLHLQQVLESFAAEACRVLEPQEHRLLDLHLGLFVLSDGPGLSFKQLASILRIPATGLRLREEQAIKQLRTHLRLPQHSPILRATQRAASAWCQLLGRPSSKAVLDAFAVAGGSRSLLWFASVVLGGLNTRERWDGSPDLFDQVVLRLLARRGPMSVDEVSRAVMAVLPPEEVGERFDPALRIRLLAPGQWRPDGKLALPDELPSRLPGVQRHHRRERRLHALIGVLEEQGTASVPQLLEGLAVRLPVSNLPSAETARGLLRAEQAIFTGVGRGRYGLVNGAASTLLLDRQGDDNLWAGLEP